MGAGGSGYLARLGGGRQARVRPVVAPYGHHAGVDFVAQFQGEHGQQHAGGGCGEDGWRPEAGAADPDSPAAVKDAGIGPTLLPWPGPGATRRGSQVPHPRAASYFCSCARPPSFFCGCAGSALLPRLRYRSSPGTEPNIAFLLGKGNLVLLL